MRNKNETTPLKTRAEKVRAFLRQPVTRISLYTVGLAGTITTPLGIPYLAHMFAASGDPNATTQTALAAGLAGTLSFATMFYALKARDIFSDNSYRVKQGKKFLVFSVLPASLALGAAYGAGGYTFGKNALDALEQQKEIALLPAIDSAAIVKPEKIITTKKPAVTAFDAACQDNKKDWQEVKGMDGVSYRVNCSPK